MADAFLDLEQVLRSKREQLSLQEANVLVAWKARAERDFQLGLGGGLFVTWLATQRLRNPLRGAITLGAGAACGAWLSKRSFESSVEHILSLEGSRIQRELANVMLKKHHDDPWVLQRLTKHFYSEEVYDDSSVDRPVLRWRYRNFSGDSVTHSQSVPRNEETNSNNVKKSTVAPEQVYESAAADDATENPFDLVFGLAGSAEDVAQPDTRTTTTSSRRQMRREKRSRRGHRRHHHDESDI